MSNNDENINIKDVSIVTLEGKYVENFEDSSEYKNIFILEPEYQQEAWRVSQLINEAIESTDDKDYESRVNFNKAVELVKEDPKLSIVNMVDDTLTQTTSEVSLMVIRVKDVVRKMLGINLDQESEEKLSNSIEDAFVNLEKEQHKTWIFWNHTKQHSTKYSYNIYYAVKNKDTGILMMCLPVALTITVDTDKKKVLGITLYDKQSYNVRLEAIKIADFIGN